MRNPKLMDEHQSPKDLIGNELDIDRSQAFAACLPDQSIEISFIVRHYDVQELPAFLKSWEAA